MSSTAPLDPRYAQLLAEREKELLALLHRAVEPALEANTQRDVSDFKDGAVEESQAMVDDAQSAHAARELDEVHAAMRRIQDGSYGECLDCGEAIGDQRLAALPATPYCTSCQEAREHERAVARR